MKVNIVKPHQIYKQGEQDVDENRGNYLIRMGIAEKVDQTGEEQKMIKPEVENKISPITPKNKSKKAK